MSRKRASIELTLNLLHARYPRCFNREDPHPLKVGISQDLRDALPEEVSMQILRDTLADYTGHPLYLARVQVGVARVDLDGQPCGQVRPDEADYAAKRLQRARQAAPAVPRPPSPPPLAPVPRRGDGFAGLRAAAKNRAALAGKP
jgi:ProP effector